MAEKEKINESHMPQGPRGRDAEAKPDDKLDDSENAKLARQAAKEEEELLHNRKPGEPEPTPQSVAAIQSRARGGVSERQALDQSLKLPVEQYINQRALDTKLDPNAKSANGPGTNREFWEKERNGHIEAARTRSELVPDEVLVDNTLFDGKVQVITVMGVPVSVSNASVGAQIKRQESQFPTQTNLYEWKCTIDGQQYDSNRPVTREELVPAVMAFIRGQKGQSAQAGQAIQSKEAKEAQEKQAAAAAAASKPASHADNVVGSAHR